MNRYQIASASTKSNKYSFKPSQSVVVIYEYMKICVSDHAIFNSSNMREALIDAALVKLSRETDIPIIVWSRNKSKLMSIAYSYKYIYDLNSLPDKYVNIIAYKVLTPNNLKIYLKII